MPRLSFFAAVVALLLCPNLSFEQAPPKAPQPGPEQKRLSYFVGTWDFRLDMKPSPFGPGGVVTGTDHNEMLPGGFFLVRRYETKSPAGEIRGLEVIGYDAESKAYVQHGFNNFGEAHVYRGTVEGDTWTWTYDTLARAQAMKVRITLKEVSPTLQTYKSDISPDGRTWTNVLDGTLTKVK